MTDRQPWVVLQEGERRRWGGDLRRAFIFAELARATGAVVGTSWSATAVRSTIARAAGSRPSLLRRRRPRLASADLLPSADLARILASIEPVALDVHDDPVRQRALFGLHEPDVDAALEARWRANLAAFQWLVAPSASFAELAGLDPDRRLVVSNGTDPRHIRPQPFPDRPAIGVVTGAAPGRGLETLVEAARRAREQVPEVVLLLFLAAPTPTARAYLDALRTQLLHDPWVEIGEPPYADLSAALARASVLCVPHPPGAYLDAALPVKLFDSMAAGRPVAVTPRTEMAAVVVATGGGRVAAGDTADDLAEAIVPYLLDGELARRDGANGRRAAEQTYDWRSLGEALARSLLERSA